MSGDIPKLLKPLAATAREQGWEISKTQRGHLRWRSPVGALVFSASTPSDQRVVKNVKSELRRKGLQV